MLPSKLGCQKPPKQTFTKKCNLFICVSLNMLPNCYDNSSVSLLLSDRSYKMTMMALRQIRYFRWCNHTETKHKPFSKYLSSFPLWYLYNYKHPLMNLHYIIHDKDSSWIGRTQWMWSSEISTTTGWHCFQGETPRTTQAEKLHPMGGFDNSVAAISIDSVISRSKGIHTSRLQLEYI